MPTTSAPVVVRWVLRDVMMTRIPNAWQSCVTLLPIVPRPPMSPMVFPISSKCGSPRMLCHPGTSTASVHSFRCTWFIEQLSDRTNVITVWAIASVEYTGMLHTVMPRARAAAIAMLLYPVPASAISSTDAGSAAIVSASTSISFVTRIRAPGGTRSSVCARPAVPSWSRTSPTSASSGANDRDPSKLSLSVLRLTVSAPRAAAGAAAAAIARACAGTGAGRISPRPRGAVGGAERGRHARKAARPSCRRAPVAPPAV